MLLALGLQPRAAPVYSAATIVNSATSLSVLSPNAFATIYGSGLAGSTRALTAADLSGGLLPVLLPGTGARVFVDGIAAPLWYVSPQQINFLIPPQLAPGREVRIWTTYDGRQGPEVLVRLSSESPGLFALDPETVIAVRLDGSLVKPENPAMRKEMVILFATGLGPTNPDTPYRELARGPAPLARLADFRLLLNEEAVARQQILYAGAAPQFAGLYQINLAVPEDAPLNPEVRIAMGDSLSPRGLRLPLK